MQLPVYRIQLAPAMAGHCDPETEAFALDYTTAYSRNTHYRLFQSPIQESMLSSKRQPYNHDTKNE